MGVNLFDSGELGNEIMQRMKRLRPKHARMNEWLNMYLLYDNWQDNKPLGERRFTSNDPMSIVDTSTRILSRFALLWTLATDEFKEDDDETRKLYGDLERSLYGFMEDIDEDLVERGEMPARYWMAQQLLLRGMGACKVHMTEKAGRESNIVYAQYDSRFVLETYRGDGLDSFIGLTPMDGEELMYEYPDKFQGDEFPNDAPVVKIEVWDRKKFGVTYSQGSSANFSPTGKWCIDPVEHGFFDSEGNRSDSTLNRLPFVIRSVNGVAIREKPIGNYKYATSPTDIIPTHMRNMLAGSNFSWRTTRRSVAEHSRSILAPIEKHYYQFNEAVASIWQAFQKDSFGTYFLATRGGQVPEEIQQGMGSGGVIGIERGDTVQSFPSQRVSEALLRFSQIIQEEKQKSTIDAVLQSQGDFTSGFHQARAEQVALNSLQPWIYGMESWGSGVGQLITDQIRVYGGGFKKAVTLGYSSADTGEFHRVEFDPSSLKELGRIPIKASVEPALPVDLMERAQVAGLLVNGRRPLISRATAQERVLRIKDPIRENKRIWQDIAETDPVVIMSNISQALTELGDEEGAKLWGDRLNMAMIVEMLQRAQAQQLGINPDEGSRTLRGQGRGDVQGSDRPGATPSPEQQPPEFRGEGREQQ